MRHGVARVFIKDDPVFCHRDRTGTCVGGNLGVRSFRDNVASARSGRQLNREGTLRLPASQGGQELGLEGMANSGEALLSRRYFQQAKEAERLEPKDKWRGRGVGLSPLADVVLPAEEAQPNPFREWYSCGTWVKPHCPHKEVEGHPRGWTGGRGGKGCWRKRRPGGNSPDRGSNFALL